MFYSEYVLAKRGPLAKIWLAAHWNKRLNRAQIQRADVVDACQTIIEPPAKLALRTSGHLLLGVVRIHERKQKTLMNDCTDAFVRIKLAFRPGVVDLPAGKNEAAFSSITLQETFADFEEDDLTVPDLTLVDEEQMHLGRDDELTLQEDPFVVDPSQEAMMMMEDFGGQGMAMEGFADVEQGRTDDAGFLEPEVGRDHDITAQSMDDFGVSHDMSMSVSMDQHGIDGAKPQGGDFSFDVSRQDISRMDEEDPMMMDYQLQQQQQEEEEFAPLELAELDDGVVLDPLEDTPITVKISRRKRKLLVDQVTEISGKQMRYNLSEAGAAAITRQSPQEGRLAYDAPPPTRAAIRSKLEDEEGIDVLFTLPMHRHIASGLRDMLSSRLRWVERRQPAEEEQLEEEFPQDGNMLPLEGNMDDMHMLQAEEDPSMYVDQSIAGPNFSTTLDSTMDQAGAMDMTAGSEFGRSAVADDGIFAMTEEERVAPFGEDSAQMTAEEYAQAGYSNRTRAFVKNLQGAFEQTAELSYFGMTNKATKRKAAAVLFELLVLKTKGYIHVEQAEPYADIRVQPTEQLSTL